MADHVQALVGAVVIDYAVDHPGRELPVLGYETAEFTVIDAEEQGFRLQLAEMIDILRAADVMENFGAEKTGHDEFADVVQKCGRERLRRDIDPAETGGDFGSHCGRDRVSPERAFVEAVGRHSGLEHRLGAAGHRQSHDLGGPDAHDGLGHGADGERTTSCGGIRGAEQFHGQGLVEADQFHNFVEVASGRAHHLREPHRARGQWG